MILLPPLAAYYRQGRELRDLKAAYAVTIDKLRTSLNAVSVLEQREAALTAALDTGRRALGAANELVAVLEAERDDARRENDEVRAALCWLEAKWFKTGGVA